MRKGRGGQEEAQMTEDGRDIAADLWELAEPILEPEGIDLVEIEFKPHGRRWVLRIYIDRPSGVTLDDCELVSRQMGALLDVKDLIPHQYHLEVSSPGIDRVLRRPRDFRNYAGSPVRIRTRKKQTGRRNFRGLLKGMDNESVVVEVEGKRVEIALENIDKARLDLLDQQMPLRNP